MKLAEFSVKNSLLVNLLSVFIICVGFVSMVQLRREAFPQVEFDVVTITTAYPGAPAEDVEKLVTTPIEKELKGISGIKEMTSNSEEGLSTIGIEIDPEAREKDKVIDDIERAVDRVKDLPEEIEDDPYIFELSADEFPIIEISVGGDHPEWERRKYAEALEDQLLDIDGVASVMRIAWRDKEFWVEVDPDKLQQYHVSMDEISDTLKTRNITLPGGPLTTPSMEYSVRISGEFRTPQEVEDVVIRANDAGHWLKIKDIARVVDTFEDETHIPKVNGKRSVSMVVVKSKQGDVITVVDSVKKVVAEFESALPEGMEIIITNDFSYYVKRRLNVLKMNGVIGIVLVLVVLFLFLDPVPAFMTALGLPIALFTTFGVMLVMDTSINLITMLGLIIVLGMLVDDGIIVAENVYRYIEQGMSPKEAAIKGTSEVIAPVTVTILTTCAAFMPLLFMKDILGKFIRFIPIIVMVALGSSLLEAFIILPSHLADFVKGHKFKSTHKDNPHKDRRWFHALLNFYTKVIHKALAFRYLVILMVFLTFVGSIFVAVKKMKVIMFTGEGIEEFHVRAEAPKGTPLEKLDELMIPVEKLIASLPEEDLDASRTYLGAIEEERGFDPNAKRGTHLGQIRVFLTPSQKRKRTPQEIIESLRPKLAEIEGFDRLYFHMPREGPPVGQPVEIGIKGDDFAVLEEIARKFMAALDDIEGVTDIVLGYEFGKKQLKIAVDENKAKQYDLSVGQVAATVRTAFDGTVATSIKPTKAEEEIDVLVRFPESVRNDRQKAFDRILVANSKGNLVPLSSVAEVREQEGLYKINHLEGKRVVYVTAQVDGKKATSLEVNFKIQNQFKNMSEQYPGYTVKYSGEFEEQQKTMLNLGRSFLIALFLIFIILAALFNSLVQPFIVLSAIPYGIIGVIFGFLTHHRPLSFFAFMGLVGLAGIVVNDSVVLVDFINQLRKSGKARRQSIVEAGQMRLRPVIMTTVTTIAGLLSVAYGWGGGDPFLKPMALAIIWGLGFATGLTLVVIPCIYAIVDDVSEKLFHHGTVKLNGIKKKR